MPPAAVAPLEIPLPPLRIGVTTPFARFQRNPAVRVSVAILVLVVAAAVMGPILMPAAYQSPTLLQLASPSAAHWLGTDVNGRDQLYRVFVGARISLVVGLTGALVAFFIGTSYGLVSGYAGGRVDGVMMRFVEVVYSIPRLIFIIILINVVNAPFNAWLQTKLAGSAWLFLRGLPAYSKTLILILSLGLVEWLTMARIVRGQVLVLKNLQFVTAARSLGQSHFENPAAPPAAQPDGHHRRIPDADDPGGDPGREFPFLPGPRGGREPVELGHAAQRRRAGDQPDQEQLVAAGVPGGGDVSNLAVA